MNYFKHMLRVCRYDESVYKEVITNDKLSLWYTSINLSVLGIFYSVFSIYFSSYILENTHKSDLTLSSKLMVLMMGISLTFLLHGSLSLFVWAFTRGFGGSTLFMPIYLAAGMASVVLWPLAPALSAFKTGLAGSLTYIYMLFYTLYALGVFFHAVKSASGLPFTRMLIVTAVIIIYIGCFMYLWVV